MMEEHGSGVPAGRTIAGLTLVHRGKVRDCYAVGEQRLLLVASDRLSAFDAVLPNPVPYKGSVLTQLSAFWFARTAHLIPNHLISADAREIEALSGIADVPGGRTTLVRRAQRIDVECVVRGYLSGSGWAEYAAQGTLAGISLPAGLRESDALATPAFTPAIKNDRGHDQNVTVEYLTQLLGMDLTRRMERASHALYAYAHAHALARGMIIADTKFEFGLVDGELTLIDEALTPDSSRFWNAETYSPGGPQISFDKQPVRDFLSRLGWRGEVPAPALPDEVIAATTNRYRRAYELLTGRSLDDAY